MPLTPSHNFHLVPTNSSGGSVETQQHTLVCGEATLTWEQLIQQKYRENTHAAYELSPVEDMDYLDNRYKPNWMLAQLKCPPTLQQSMLKDLMLPLHSSHRNIYVPKCHFPRCITAFWGICNLINVLCGCTSSMGFAGPEFWDLALVCMYDALHAPSQSAASVLAWKCTHGKTLPAPCLPACDRLGTSNSR